MTIKLFEVRDRATFIPVLAVQLDDKTTDAEEYLLHRAGYGRRYTRDYVFLTNLEDGKSTYDPFKWDGRTMIEAHRYIRQNFDTLESGDVIDVEFILGESAIKKVSERLA